MFVGHYSTAFAAKAVAPRTPLWVLLLAAQFVDVLWDVFVLLGIEHVRLDPALPSNPLDLYHVPYTHSLVATVAWSVVGFAIASRGLGLGRREALAAALVVSSHWFLDLLVHRPDLPLFAGPTKLGLGLWNYPLPAYLFEVVCVAATMGWCARALRLTEAANRRWFAFAVLLLMLQTATSFGPLPTSVSAVVLSALAVYLLVPALGRVVERGL